MVNQTQQHFLRHRPFINRSVFQFLTVFSFCIFHVIACNRPPLRAVGDVDTADWKNESQFSNISPIGRSAISVVTQNENLALVSPKSYERKANIQQAKVVSFTDSEHGWIVDRQSRVWTTSDGGNSWRVLSTPPNGDKGFYLPRQLIFVDELHGWLVGIFQIWRTTDGGKTWEERFSISKSSEDRAGRLYRGAFVSRDSGWLGSSGGAVIHTNDGGKTWTTALPVNEQIDLHDVFFWDENKGWLIGSPGGGLYSTQDGGKSWRLQLTTPDGTYLRSVHFVNSSEGWAVGFRVRNQDREAVVLHSFDGGDKWTEVATNLNERFFYRVYFHDRDHGWLLARDNIYYTDDGGQSFRAVLRLPPLKNR